MMPAHVPPAPPRLAINLSPAAATRALAMLGLGVALSATVATTLAVIATSPEGLPTETPAAIVQFTNWLVSVPWLFVAVVLAASSRVERVVRPGAGPAWATLAFAAAACAAMQVVGRDLVSTWTLVTRAGLIVVSTLSLSLAFRQFLAGPSRLVRAEIVVGVFAGLLGGLGPFAMLGRFAGVAGTATFAPIDALLSGADALLGLVARHRHASARRWSTCATSCPTSTSPSKPRPIRPSPSSPRRSVGTSCRARRPLARDGHSFRAPGRWRRQAALPAAPARRATSHLRAT